MKLALFLTLLLLFSNNLYSNSGANKGSTTVKKVDNKNNTNPKTRTELSREDVETRRKGLDNEWNNYMKERERRNNERARVTEEERKKATSQQSRDNADASKASGLQDKEEYEKEKEAYLAQFRKKAKENTVEEKQPVANPPPALETTPEDSLEH